MNVKTKISEHFLLEEFMYSRMAIRYGIDNTPSEKAIHCLRYLADNLLEPLRMLYDAPIHITSGYRCKELNRLVKGNVSSQHLKGEAVDIYVTDPERFCKLLLKTSNLEFDQLIWYTKRNFIHLSLTSVGVNKREYIYI